MSWKENLIEDQKEYTDWNVKEMRAYLSKLEKLGCDKIKIIDNESIKFRLPSPANSSDALLYILKTYPMPTLVKHSRKNKEDYLELNWR